MTELAGRRRRRRRLAVGSTVAALVIGLAATGTLWQRSVRAARAAEAQKLNALGRLELVRHPSAALANAIASLELADSREARLLALEALWKGPTTFIVDTDGVTNWAEFSRDGHWLLRRVGGPPAQLRLIRADGTAEDIPHIPEENLGVFVGVGPEGDHFWTHHGTRDSLVRKYALWSAPTLRRLKEAQYGANAMILRSSWGGRRTLLEVVEGERAHIDAIGFDGSRERLGTVSFAFPDPQTWYMHTAMDEWTGRWFGAVANNEVLVLEIGEHGLSEPRRLGRHEGSIAHVEFDPFGRFLVTAGVAGEIQLWDPAGVAPPTVLQGPPGVVAINLRPDGSYLAAGAKNASGGFESWIWHLSRDEPRLIRRLDLGREFGEIAGDPIGRRAAKVLPDSAIRLWSLDAPAAAEPLTLLANIYDYRRVSFHPNGTWLAATSTDGLALWPLTRRYPSVIDAHDEEIFGLTFSPDGNWLASGSLDGSVRLWPLADDSPDRVHVVLDDPDVDIWGLAVLPQSDRLLASTSNGVRVIPLNGDPSRTLQGFSGAFRRVAIDRDGRLAAGARRQWPGKIDLWDVSSGRTLEVADPGEDLVPDRGVMFTSDGHLLAVSEAGLVRWILETGDTQLLVDGVDDFTASADGRRLFLNLHAGNRPGSSGAVLDVETGVVTPLERHGDRIVAAALDEAGDVVVTASLDDIVRVGPTTGEEPHLLLGQEDVFELAIDPRGRWIAGAIDRTSICLWPMPDLSTPPLDTLPRGELLAKLRSLTNLRLVRDEDSTTGWTLTHEAFRGWETVPTW
jgi:WD40 repeat protein